MFSRSGWRRRCEPGLLPSLSRGAGAAIRCPMPLRGGRAPPPCHHPDPGRCPRRNSGGCLIRSAPRRRPRRRAPGGGSRLLFWSRTSWGCPFRVVVGSTGWGAATAFWFLGCVDDAELSECGCPSRTRRQTGTIGRRCSTGPRPIELLACEASLGGVARLVVVSRVLSERLRGRIAIFHRWLRSSRSVLFVQRARISRIPSLG